MGKQIPNIENSTAAAAGEMTIPNQMKNVNYGKKTKPVNKKVVIRDTATGTVYGSRVIATKESQSNKLTFKTFLLESATMTELPKQIVSELQKNIRDGAKDLTQNWANALELVNRAYAVARVSIPTPDKSGAWKQYTDLMSYAVAQLSSTRGRDGTWRLTPPLMKESLDDEGIDNRKRYFVTIPGEESCEIDGDDMDSIIDKLTNTLRRRGCLVRVELRDKEHAELGVWVNGIKQDKVEIRQL